MLSCQNENLCQVDQTRTNGLSHCEAHIEITETHSQQCVCVCVQGGFWRGGGLRLWSSTELPMTSPSSTMYQDTTHHRNLNENKHRPLSLMQECHIISRLVARGLFNFHCSYIYHSDQNEFLITKENIWFVETNVCEGRRKDMNPPPHNEVVCMWAFQLKAVFHWLIHLMCSCPSTVPSGPGFNRK